MSNICSCDSFSIGNMGLPACVQAASETRRLIFTRYIKDDGTIPAILSTDDLTTAFWNTHIQRYDNSGTLVDADERWYITPNLENATDERGEPTYQEFNMGSRAFVRQANRQASYFIPNAAAELLAQIEKFKCQSELGVWLVDFKDNLIGNGSESGKLQPIKIDVNSLDARLIKATGGNTVQGIMLMFDFDMSEFDHDLKMIYAEDISVLPSTLKALIDVVPGTPSSISTTGFTIQLNTKYGSFKSPQPIKNLVAADFVLAEIDPTPGAITISSCTESSTTPGLYSFTFTAQTSGDILKLTLKKVGFDGEVLEAVQIEIP